MKIYWAHTQNSHTQDYKEKKIWQKKKKDWIRILDYTFAKCHYSKSEHLLQISGSHCFISLSVQGENKLIQKGVHMKGKKITKQIEWRTTDSVKVWWTIPNDYWIIHKWKLFPMTMNHSKLCTVINIPFSLLGQALSP